MTRNAKKVIIFMLMVMVIALYFISGTYARYASEITGDAKVSTANWKVAFKNGDAAITDISTLTFKVQNNTNVVPGKIAPSVTAKATINVDLTGTEVAVDYTATIDPTALKAAFGASADRVTVTVNGEASATGTVNLINNAAFTGTDAIVPIEIAITWSDVADTATADDKKAGNTSDTGKAGQTDLTLPVTLTIQQHI